jgi:hypothetical protein|nr:AAA family ATPase [uncultured Dongia sp.]
MLGIQELTLANGKRIPLAALTVIVGPNNAGKTLLLNECAFALQGLDDSRKIVAGITLPQMSGDECFAAAGLKIEEGSPTQYRIKTALPYQGLSLGIDSSYIKGLKKTIGAAPLNERTDFLQHFGRAWFVQARTEDRLAAAKRQSTGQEDGLLQSLYESGSATDSALSVETTLAFGQSMKLDSSTLTEHVIRIGKNFDQIPPNMRDARPLLDKYETLDVQGDGFKSFVTTLLFLTLMKRPVTFIDEPEAFLHPPQALQLGQVMARTASDQQQIICSTHSTDVLRGMLDNDNVTIVRLSRQEDNTVANVLEKDKIAEIARNPLLKSGRVLDALFYKGAVVVEGDSDRALYQAVAQQCYPGEEIHYVNAHNKQTAHKVANAYRAIKVPHVVIVDFDVLRESAELKRLLPTIDDATPTIQRVMELQAVIANEVLQKTDREVYLETLAALTACIAAAPTTVDAQEDASRELQNLKRNIDKAQDYAKKWAKVKEHGRDALSPVGQKHFDDLEQLCRQLDIFIVPVGGLEGWLKSVTGSRKKGRWIGKALEHVAKTKLGDSEPLVKFVDDVHQHLRGSV